MAAFVMAHKRLDARVDHLMCLHVSLCDEPQVALVALEWPFTCVAPDVRFQVASLVELLQAVIKWTNEKLHLILGSLDRFYF